MNPATWKEETDLGHPGQVDPVALKRWLRFGRPLVRFAFRPRFEGIENFPPQSPFMIVANHSGLGNAEIAALVVFLLENRERIGPVAAMIHPLSYRGFQGPMMKRLGAIPSTYPAAKAALASGVSLLVMPGGDHEAMRPVWQANEVQFGGRQGFLKIALRAGVPIVPVGISGSHYTAPVLWRSERILPRLLVVPRLMGMKRYALSLLGLIGCAVIFVTDPLRSIWISLGLSWLWLILPFATLPWIPWSIRIKIGAPISASELFVGANEKSLSQAYTKVQSAVQALLK